MSDTSGNNFEPHIAYDEQDIYDYYSEEESSEKTESTVYSDNTIDYTNHLENLEGIGIFLICILIGCSLAICFIQGLNNE